MTFDEFVAEWRKQVREYGGEVSQEAFDMAEQSWEIAFAAGAASRDAEVAEHIEEITALKEVIKHGDAQRERDMELAGEERDQLRAQINVLRELVIHSTDYRLGNPAYEASIATTPEQSLFEYRNKVIEE